jgi:CheY-like chemotaxis protein
MASSTSNLTKLQDMRNYITSLLGKYCEVQQVIDGAEALAELRRTTYDLVLSDFMMPKISGAELLDAIRADLNLRAIPFIMLSARAGEEARLDGLARGADGMFSTHPVLVNTKR